MPERRHHLDLIAIASLVLCCFLWGLNQVAAKVAMPEVAPLQQAAVRSAVAALLVWMWARYRRIPLFDRDATLPGGLLAGGLFALEFACIFGGLALTTASRMVVFIYVAPFVVALGMPFISASERLSRLQMAGLVLAFSGVAWAFAEGFTQPAAGPTQWLGDALGVAAGVLWAATTLVIRGSRLNRAAAEKTLFYQLAVSGLALTAAAAVWGGDIPRQLSTLAIASLVFQTVIVTFASYLVWFWLVRHYPATRLSAFTLLTPLFGLMLGGLLLQEPITARLVMGLAAVGAGIVLINRTSSTRGGARSG